MNRYEITFSFAEYGPDTIGPRSHTAIVEAEDEDQALDIFQEDAFYQIDWETVDVQEQPA